MRVLAIDTSSIVASVAIVEEEKLVAEFTINNKQTLYYATWEKYHCNAVINDVMKCIKWNKKYYSESIIIHFLKMMFRKKLTHLLKLN